MILIVFIIIAFLFNGNEHMRVLFREARIRMSKVIEASSLSLRDDFSFGFNSQAKNNLWLHILGFLIKRTSNAELC